MQCEGCHKLPRCKLPTLKNDKGYKFVHNIQIPGALATDVERVIQEINAGHRPDPPKPVTKTCGVFCIGEAPGYNEDKYGWPFCGGAGSVLNWFLTSSGFDLSDVLLTNTVRCRPPKNRDPAIAEIKACQEWLLEEIKQHQPKVIMLLGLKALKLFNLNKQGGMNSLHGQVFEKKLPSWPDGPTFKVIPTYHPASFLHSPNPKKKRRVLEDFILARKLAFGNKPPKDSYYKAEHKVIKDVGHLRDVVEEIRAAGLYSVDTESVSLGYRKYPMRTIQLSIGKGKTWVLPMYIHDPDGIDWKLTPAWEPEGRKLVIDALSSLFSDERMQVIGQNIKYDLNVIRYWTGLRIKGWLWDVMLLHHLLDVRPPHDLESMADTEFSVGPYSNPVNEIVGFGKKKRVTYDHVPDETLWLYGATDAELTYRLFCVFYKEMTAELLKIYCEETHPAIRTVAKQEWRGAFINIPALEALGEEYRADLETLADKCRALTKPGFNPGSSQQVAEALLAQGFKEVVAPEKSKGYCADKNILQTIQDDSELASLVVEYRSLNKIIGTYLDNVIDDLNDDGRLRYSFYLEGTASGRISNKFFHQLHVIDEDRIEAGLYVLRDLVSCEPGHSLVVMDYSQVELRIMALLSKDEKFLQLFRDGIDVHEATTASALGIPLEAVGKYNRIQVGKKLNFGVIFGSHGYSLSRGDYIDVTTGRKVPIGMSKVREFLGSFREDYPGIGSYIESVPHRAKMDGNKVESVFGRVRHLPGLSSTEMKIRAEAERQAVNHTIQSPAGTITIRTANMVDKMLEEKEVPEEEVGYVLGVHDSLIYDIADEHLSWFIPELKRIATRPIVELGNYSFPIDIGVGQTWARADLAAKAA